jgi:formate dehydrogenase subunit beta
MAITAKIDVKDKDILGSLQNFLKNILETDEIQSLLVPQHLPMKNMVMPTLVTDSNHLNGVDPISPAFPMNAAKIVSRLTRKPMGAKVAAVLRP